MAAVRTVASTLPAVEVVDIIDADIAPSSRTPLCLLPDALADKSRLCSWAKGSGSRFPLRRTSNIRSLGVGICKHGSLGHEVERTDICTWLVERPQASVLFLTWAMSLPHEVFRFDACSAHARAELCPSLRISVSPFDVPRRSLGPSWTACCSVEAFFQG
jgi:hypothetical protein